MSFSFMPAPAAAGGYRWYYLDASCGEWTAVAIFMLGSQFSYRYSVAGGRGEPASRHCAVNFALYRLGRRKAWVFSEYGGAQVAEHTLRVGGSTLTYEAGAVRARIDEPRAPFGDRLCAELALRPEGPGHPEVQLVKDQPHFWQPLAPRATATISVPGLGVEQAGDGYHDTNHGDEALGAGLPGWEWSRAHSRDATQITYRPWAGGEVLEVRAELKGTTLTRRAAQAEPGGTSGWGLKVPHPALGSTLESSPFYARFEDRTDVGHVLTEVADFRRFHRPWVRWMARFRTRTGVAA